jgi:hypothetical protein
MRMVRIRHMRMGVASRLVPMDVTVGHHEERHDRRASVDNQLSVLSEIEAGAGAGSKSDNQKCEEERYR